MSDLEKSFKERFLEATRLGGNMAESAKQGRLPSVLNDFEIAILINDGKPDNAALPSPESVSGKIRLACLRGELKAELTDRDLWGSRKKTLEGNLSRGTVKIDQKEQIYCYVHRDDARRYFAKLGLEPDAGSPLWCWLRGKASDQATKLKPSQQDKADFQQVCLDVWQVSSTITITGNDGIVNHPDVRAFLKKYKPTTLEGWAREIAPTGVKGKRGAPRKNTPPIKK